MIWSGKFQLIKMRSELWIQAFFKDAIKDVAKVFVQSLIAHPGAGGRHAAGIPAWTGQARASLTTAANLVGLSISYSDAKYKGGVKGKNPSTGATMGTAHFRITKNLYWFGFSCNVSDLVGYGSRFQPAENQYGYMAENEYEPRPSERKQQKEAPWHAIDVAGENFVWWVRKEWFPKIAKEFRRTFYRHEITF